MPWMFHHRFRDEPISRIDKFRAWLQIGQPELIVATVACAGVVVLRAVCRRRRCRSISVTSKERSATIRIHPAATSRAEGQPARDLGVLAAARLKRERGHAAVLELFAGSGMRSARYLLEGGADFVWANDANQELFQTLLANLQQAASAAGQMSQDYPCSDLLPEWAAPHSWRLQEGLPLHGREAGRHPGWRHRSSADKDSSTSAQGWRVTHWESKSLLGYCQAVNRQFDFVDVDASGCWSHIGATLELVRPGGLLYLAATGLTSSKPSLAFQSLGVRMARCPPTETLHDHMARALIWRMVSAADSLGLIAQPLFSLYRGAGDVFRILLRVVRRSGESTLKAFCCGVCCDCNIYVGPLEDESLFGARHARSRCRNCHSSDFVCWGPLWTGSLNSDPFLAQLQADAAVRGWLQEPLSEGGRMSPLAELLPRLRAEASAEAAAEASGATLRPWTLRLPAVAQRGGCAPPQLGQLLEELSAAGHTACRSSLGPEHFRTSADVSEVVTIAQNLSLNRRPKRTQKLVVPRARDRKSVV